MGVFQNFGLYLYLEVEATVASGEDSTTVSKVKQLAKRKRLENGEASDLPRRTKRHRSSDQAVTSGREKESGEELQSSDQEDKRLTTTLEGTSRADKTHKTKGICVTVEYVWPL